MKKCESIGVNEEAMAGNGGGAARQPRRTRSYFIPATTIIIGVVLSLTVFHALRTRERQVVRLEFEREAENIHAIINEQMEDNLQAVATLRTFIGRREVTRMEFRKLAKPLLLARGMQALAWVPRVAEAKRRDYERRVLRDGFPAFQITEAATHGKMARAARRPEYFPVYYVEPYRGNETVLGLDLASNAACKETLDSSRDTGKMLATAAVTLVQERENQAGILVFAPVYLHEEAADSAQERRENLLGFALGVFRIGVVMEKSLAYLKTGGIDVYLYDRSAPEVKSLLYSRTETALAATSDVYEQGPATGLKYAKDLDVAGRKWQIVCRATPAFASKRETWQPLIALAAGLLISLLLAAYLSGMIRRSGEMSSMVEKLKSAERSLRKSEEFARSILNSVDEAFLVVDRDFRIVTANTAFCRHAGISHEEIAGKHCYRSYYGLEKPCFESGLDCPVKRLFETGQPSSAQHSYTDKEGSQLYGELASYPLKDEAGQIASVIEVITNVTEKRTLEAQLRHAQKMEVVGQLAGGIAHDFNNILAVIMGIGDLLTMKLKDDDPLRLDVVHLIESAERGARLTQSLLAFSRKQIMNPVNVDLNEIIGRTEKFLRRVIGEDIELKTFFREGPVVVNADSGQIEQVLMNLTTNARDAMSHGGVLTIETTTLEIDASFIRAHGFAEPGKYALVSVSDTGTGMDEETQMKIFEPFFTTKEVGRGTGLGLSMAYGIIKQHKGFINVYSEKGRGTTFRIYLPLISTRGYKDEQRMRDLGTPARGGTETMLLAEDDDALRKLYRTVLEELGYGVVTAADGDEAVAAYLANRDRIKLLILDLIMPKKGGRETYNEIKKVSPGIKVLFISGYTADKIYSEELTENVVELMQKPMSTLQLAKKVRDMLDDLA